MADQLWNPSTIFSVDGEMRRHSYLKWRIMTHGNDSYGNGPFQYDRTIAVDPRFTDAYCKRGMTRLRHGEEAAAQRNFNWLLPRLRPFHNRSAIT